MRIQVLQEEEFVTGVVLYEYNRILCLDIITAERYPLCTSVRGRLFDDEEIYGAGIELHSESYKNHKASVYIIGETPEEIQFLIEDSISALGSRRRGVEIYYFKFEDAKILDEYPAEGK